MQQAQQRKLPKAVKLLLALLLAAGLIPLANFACTNEAYAETAWLSVGRNVYYDNYSTTYFSDGNGWVAYCAQPSRATPASGTYTKMSLRDAYQGGSGVGSPAAVMYFGYGGPGFDPSMWPSTWYNGASMTNDNYYAITHILIADRMYWDAEAALTGCSAAFRQYYGYYCQGQEWWVDYVGMGSSANNNAVYMRMIAAWQALPSSVRNAYIDSCYALSTGGFTQNIVVACPNEPTGSLELQKSSANSSITSGNACYTLEGATYGIYRDKTCTSQVASFSTNAEGTARADDLAIGTYYVKEISASSGYALDDTVYSAAVSGGKVTYLNVEETPQSNAVSLWLSKKDADTNTSSPQGDATLGGAQFSIRYYDGYYQTAGEAEASGQATCAWVVRTDESGRACPSESYTLWGSNLLYNSGGSIVVPLGTVLVQETKAPAGYLAEANTVHVIQVTSQGSSEEVGTYNAPTISEQVIRGGVEMPKLDYDYQSSTPQGDATLDGAQFTIANASAHSVVVDGTEYAPGEDVMTIATSQGVAATTSNALPYGSYTLRETAAPDGYNLTQETWRFSIRENGVVVTPTKIADMIDNAVVRGGVSIEKRDLESQLSTPLGAASLDKTTFEITNLSDHAVVVDGISYAPGSVVTTIQSQGAAASTAADTLPYGTYSITEVSAGEGYLLTDSVARVFEIREGGTMVYLNQEGSSDDAAYNQVKRGDIKLVKARESDQARLGGIPFKITSRTTGEWHIIVTDENGEAKTSAEWNAHTAQTNANDSALLADGTIDESKLNAAAGVWFGLTAEGSLTSPNDALGALPYDTYLVEELRVQANEHLELIALDNVTITRDGYVVDLGTLDDQPLGEASLSTSARDASDGDKTVFAAPDATIVDRVEYTGLTIGVDYVLTGTLMNKETGEPCRDADGNPISASKQFTPEKTSGYEELSFTFDALDLNGSSVVCFETLCAADTGTEIAAHRDWNDYEQTVRVQAPAIGTKAADGFDGDATAVADLDTCITDTVSYRNLAADGRTYTLTGTLMDKTTGAAYLDAEGNEVTASAEFTPEEPSGSTDVTFRFNAAGQSSTSLVVFEELSWEGRMLATHADLDSATQTVELISPEVSTCAIDGIDADKIIAADPESSVTDNLSYRNVVPGRTYAVEGSIMVLSSNDEGDVVATPLLNNEGMPVTSATSFTPDAPEGTIEMSFGFDSTSLGECKLVVYERIMREGTVVASHEDPLDEAQTVQVKSPRIATYAADGADNDMVVFADPQAVIVDEVALSGLATGCDYVVRGTLMQVKPSSEEGVEAGASGADAGAGEGVNAGTNAGADTDAGANANTGEGVNADADANANANADEATLEVTPVLDEAGNPLTSLQAFTALAPAQTIEVAFEFDAVSPGEGKIVVYEELLRNDVVVAAHQDPTDEEQTVQVETPAISTEATDAADFDHALAAADEATIVDTVTYENLVVGKEYRLHGTIMDKDTGKELVVDNCVVEAETLFIPVEPTGSIQLEFTFDARELAGKTLVAFEDLSREGKTVALHADLSDEDQSVLVEEDRPAATVDEPASSMPKTGDVLAPLCAAAAIIAGVGAAVTAACALARSRKRS